MTLKEKAERKAAEITIDQLLKYIDKNPQQNLLKLLDLAEKLLGGIFPQKMLNSVRREIEKGDGVYYNYAMNVLKDVDRGVIKSMLLGFGLGVVHGTKRVRENREKYGCNVPFTILMDPTSACNCRCKGCWSAEYGHKDSLTFDEMAGVISEGKELGAHMFMFTGGEPLLRKDDLIRLCEQNPDCAFLVYTNGTLVDEKFCDELLRVGNMALALSIEGTEETTDARRGEGLYQKVLKAMSLLKSKGCLFGMSVCYTRENMDQVTSDEFMNKMLDCGVKFGLYFNFMPIGHSAPVELIPTPEQREYMYKWLRKTRNGETGKPMFVMDFQDDGEYVGGCIARRQKLHPHQRRGRH